ncbi:MAG: ABC transporter permease subunit [Bacteroidales bacterium]|nr:ABC transporter permease subunit [Bacteroidales bacterium]
MKNNVGTIIRKEFARFFGDRSLVFTSVIMPGLLIYVIYTLMGSFLGDKVQEEIAKDEQQKTEFISPLTADEEHLLDSLQEVRSTAYYEYEANLGTSDEDELGDLLGNLIPMLIIMLLFSGSMAVAPTAIAGEKERGTIATLLVTPMKRSELALGKIISLSCFALLSGLSSFLGIILSLPKMLNIGAEEADQLNLALPYQTSHFALIFLLIVSTVLIIISAISIFSAWAKDVKSAGTMITPLMLFIMLAALTPMIGSPSSPLLYLIPVYNSAQCMASVFSFKVELMPLIITISANIIYTIGAVIALAKMFNSEKIMFSK